MTSLKVVHKKERGFCNSYFDSYVGLVEWNDNRVVHMASHFVGVQPTKAGKRFSQRQKRNLMLPSPTAS